MSNISFLYCVHRLFWDADHYWFCVCRDKPPHPPGTTDSTEAATSEERIEAADNIERHRTAMADASIFCIISLSSYYISESVGCSGIISALLCGLICNQFAVRNMSVEARTYSHAFFMVLAGELGHARAI